MRTQGIAADDHRYQTLIAGYSEPHRHYHTLQHLDECFANLDDAHDLAQRIYEVSWRRGFKTRRKGIRR
jgi:predicted metal-dependent HD superfamily phosphohydrolase